MEIKEYANSSKLFDGHFRLLRPLSTDGGTADVWLAIDTNTIDSLSEDEDNTDVNDSGMLVAIKIYRPKNALDIDGEQRFRDEYKIVYECRHENLLQPTSFSIFDGVPYLVLPYCKYGSSEKLIGKSLTSDEIWKFILDVSSGLYRLHTNEPSIIHQDIKPANILIDNNKDFAITDFGISSKHNGVHNYYYDDGNSGTMSYMAPERFLDDAEPMCQSDVWAFGATLYEILTGKVPFGEEGGKFQKENNVLPSPISGVSSDIQRLINDCLSMEPGNRPSAQYIKEAAQVKRYPIKSNKKYIWGVGIVGIAVAIIGAVMLVASPLSQKTREIPEISIEESFKIALKDLDSNEPLIVKRGLSSMDSLSSLKYIPAIYELACTYGWYSEGKPLRRKEVLGIKVYNDEFKKGLPITDRYTNEACALFSKILNLNDSNYAKINAESAYRLAGYYANDNKVLKRDDEKSKRYMLQSQEWAILANDTDLLSKINESLKRIK